VEPTASQVTDPPAESGDRTGNESGDRRARIVGPRAWNEGQLTRGQVPDAQSWSEERGPIYNMWPWNRREPQDVVVWLARKCLSSRHRRQVMRV